MAMPGRVFVKILARSITRGPYLVLTRFWSWLPS